MAKRSSFGNMVRRRLSDITNSLPNPKSPVIVEKLPPDSASGKDYIDHLAKENMGLVKLIQDKNKIIELSGIEIENLRVSLQKMQLQNWNLAQSNSHMSAELNLVKERLKTLQHELVCKEAVLKAKNLELKGPGEVNVENNGLELETKEQGMVDVEAGTNEDNKPEKGSRRRHPSRSRSLGQSTSFQQVAEKEAMKTKRRCLRRQSATYRIQHQEPAENLFEIEGDTFSVARSLNSPAHADGSYSVPSSEVHESLRTSIGRPLRRAVEKVESYKERSINIKMRRTE
ncbi:SHUGOSHIN 2-like [Forsythia ovata]|uniref:SHUGOSHIN 2-like n=1 Tax=Forsythia ovata TaxID=205694 RepID=A0ABD1X631_9LAMI